MSATPLSPTAPIDVRGGRRIKVSRVGGTALRVDLEDGSFDNDVLGPMPAQTLKGNAAGAEGQPQDIPLSDLVEAGNPLGDALAQKVEPDTAIPALDSSDFLRSLRDALKFQGIYIQKEVRPEQTLAANGIGKWQRIGKCNGVTGAGPDGLSPLNETAIIQEWLNTAAQKGLPAVYAGGHFVSGTITSPTAGPVVVRPDGAYAPYAFGAGIPGDPLGTGQQIANLRKGPFFYLGHTGVGFIVSGDAGPQMGHDYTLNTIRPQPAPAASWSPTDHNYDVLVSNTRARVDLFAQNATRGVKVTNGGYNGARIRLYGQYFKEGIAAETCFDTIVIEDMYLWPSWSFFSGVRAYMLNSLDVVKINGCDGLFADNLFSIFHRNFFRYGADPTNAAHGSAIHCIGRVYSDGAGNAFLVVDPGNPLLTLYIENLQHQHISGAGFVIGPSSGGWCIDDRGDNSRIVAKIFRSGKTPEGVIRQLGANSRCVVDDPWLDEGFDLGGNGNKAFTANHGSGSYIQINGEVRFNTGLNTRSQLYTLGTSVGKGKNMMSVSAGANSTVYVGAGASTDSAPNVRPFLVTEPTVLKRVAVSCLQAPGSGQSFTYTIFKNGSDTGNGGSLTGGAGSGEFGVNVPLLPNDVWELRIVTSAGAQSTTHRIAVEYGSP